MLAILSNIVIFGTDASDPLGQPILLVWAVCTVLVGVISILAGINGWRGFPPFVSFETNSVILVQILYNFQGLSLTLKFDYSDVFLDNRNYSLSDRNWSSVTHTLPELGM